MEPLLILSEALGPGFSAYIQVCSSQVLGHFVSRLLLKRVEAHEKTKLSDQA